ncbi:MAG: hypothetical protein AB7U83_05165 [Vicinamibacterales bacterium]
MAGLTLDTGALIAFERNDRFGRKWSSLPSSRQRGDTPPATKICTCSPRDGTREKAGSGSTASRNGRPARIDASQTQLPTTPAG